MASFAVYGEAARRQQEGEITTQAIPPGVRLHDSSKKAAQATEDLLDRFGLSHVAGLSVHRNDGKTVVDISLHPDIVSLWVPHNDTTRLPTELKLDTQGFVEDLEKEILVTLMASPVQMDFPSIGVYGQGGCIDTTREGPRWVCPGTTDLSLPMN